MTEIFQLKMEAFCLGVYVGGFICKSLLADMKVDVEVKSKQEMNKMAITTTQV